MKRHNIHRRRFVKGLGAAAITLPFLNLLRPGKTRAAGVAKRVIFFYFPDGVPGPSQNGEPSKWHPTGSESNFELPTVLTPLLPFKNDCVFFRGLSMGPTDTGSHPGGAKKLLTAADGGYNESIDQYLARTIGASAPYRHLYLGAMANQNNASGDKHISYPSAGQSITPEDNPRKAFDNLFGSIAGGGVTPEVDPAKATIIDNVIDDVETLRAQLGQIEKSKLDMHLESLREVEKRIKSGGVIPAASCESPSVDTTGFTDGELYKDEKFPSILKAQIDLMVLAMACGLTKVGVIQGSVHTSELIMSRFPGTEMYTPNFDMRSHQASHYGANHDEGKAEFKAFLQQRTWWVSQFAYLLDELKKRPEDGATMLDNSIVVLCTEVCDGNTHLHDDMPFVLAGRGGGSISTGRLLQYGYERHGKLFVSIANAMGDGLSSFGDSSSGPLPGLVG
ncbi:MAG: DUF1552 domain-containing protein [Polyangiaceae bacterium]|nr:DUF1552 domain-containing protein [Polyangiaceae bacterium]